MYFDPSPWKKHMHGSSEKLLEVELKEISDCMYKIFNIEFTLIMNWMEFAEINDSLNNQWRNSPENLPKSPSFDNMSSHSSCVSSSCWSCASCFLLAIFKQLQRNLQYQVIFLLISRGVQQYVHIVSRLVFNRFVKRTWTR